MAQLLKWYEHEKLFSVPTNYIKVRYAIVLPSCRRSRDDVRAVRVETGGSLKLADPANLAKSRSYRVQ